jgi:two-component system, OmpR family, KDP operon response regulator KdpE
VSLGRVLIVDDEPMVVDMIQDVVRTLGYQTESALNGFVGLRLVSACAPDVILLDVGMPQLLGGELLKILRRDYPEIPVIMVTANQDEEYARELLQEGAFDYVRKPFDIDALGRSLQAAIASRGRGPA